MSDIVILENKKVADYSKTALFTKINAILSQT